MIDNYELISKLEEEFKYFSYKKVYNNIFIIYRNYLMEVCPVKFESNVFNHICRLVELPNPIEDVGKLNPRQFIFLYNDEGTNCSKEYCKCTCNCYSNHNKKDLKIPSVIAEMLEEVSPYINAKLIQKDLKIMHQEFMRTPRFFIIEDKEKSSTPQRNINQRLNTIGRI